jgi:hypothetical protein
MHNTTKWSIINIILIKWTLSKIAIGNHKLRSIKVYINIRNKIKSNRTKLEQHKLRTLYNRLLNQQVRLDIRKANKLLINRLLVFIKTKLLNRRSKSYNHQKVLFLEPEIQPTLRKHHSNLLPINKLSCPVS